MISESGLRISVKVGVKVEVEARVRVRVSFMLRIEMVEKANDSELRFPIRCNLFSLMNHETQTTKNVAKEESHQEEVSR